MKFFRFIAFILLLVFAAWLAKPNRAPNITSKCSSPTEVLFVQSNGEVTDAIVHLLGLTGIRILGDPLSTEKNWPEARVHLKSRALKEVVSVVQGKLDPSISWFGDPNKERWENDPKKPRLTTPQALSIVSVCLDSLQQREKTLPTKSPKAILFLGATLSRVRMRLAYLNELYDLNKLSSDLPIYVLTGERKLDEKVGETQISLMDVNNGILPFRNDWSVPHDPISDEGEMIKLVFSQSRHTAIAEKNVITVYSPKGEGRRATTESTVVQWLKEYSPSNGNYLAISNQPYNFYQESIIRRVLLQQGRPDICVDVVGPALVAKTGNDESLIDQAKNLLNNISRILYELLEIRKILKE